MLYISSTNGFPTDTHLQPTSNKYNKFYPDVLPLCGYHAMKSRSHKYFNKGKHFLFYEGMTWQMLSSNTQDIGTAE